MERARAEKEIGKAEAKVGAAKEKAGCTSSISGQAVAVDPKDQIGDGRAATMGGVMRSGRWDA